MTALLAVVEQALRAVPCKPATVHFVVGNNSVITEFVDYPALARVVVGWIGPASELIAAIDRVHADPQYLSVWAISQMHVGPYQGPKYDTELNTARAALAALPGQPGEDEK